MDRLERWYRPGLLCIGDAAHAMSPVGGVGVNYAIQDAVAAANLLAAKLRQGDVSLAELRRVQRRREWPVRLMQRLQRLPAAAISAQFKHPGAGRQRLQSFVTELPLFQRILGRIIGLGFRREHVRTPDLGAVMVPADTSGREQRHRARNR